MNVRVRLLPDVTQPMVVLTLPGVWQHAAKDIQVTRADASKFGLEHIGIESGFTGVLTNLSQGDFVPSMTFSAAPDGIAVTLCAINSLPEFLGLHLLHILCSLQGIAYAPNAVADEAGLNNQITVEELADPTSTQAARYIAALESELARNITDYAEAIGTAAQ